MNSLLVEYSTDNTVMVNGDVKMTDEALDIMTSLGIDSTKAYKILRDARKGNPLVISV